MLRFSKPKGPGLEIAADAYLAVLACRMPLPSLLEVVSPKGEAGSVPGYGVPVSSGASAPGRPLVRGVYGLASLNRKSVLHLKVLSKEEAGFVPTQAALAGIEDRFGEEVAGRVRATWTLLQLSWASYDPEVYPALDFWLACARRLAELTDGVVADAAAQSYTLPHGSECRPPGAAVWAPEHVGIVQAGARLHTAGLRKFSRPELEATQVPPGAQAAVARLLTSLAQSCLEGARPKPGDRIAAGAGQVRIADGGLDREYWGGAYALEVLPEGKGGWASFQT